MALFDLVSAPIEEQLVSVIKAASDSLFISTPYIKEYGVQVVLKHAGAKRLKVLTNLDLRNVTGAGFDINSLLALWDRFDVSVSSLGKLHAKAYIADRRVAFLTSANLTRGGLRENYEYGVILRDESLVSQMADDLDAYFKLGNVFDENLVEQVKQATKEIADLQAEIARSTAALKVSRLLRQKIDGLQTRLLENRVKGRTINAIFSDTIEYLLDSRGPLSTEELHPLIQNIHSDICDDTIDRMINGQNFGKKWKHSVRNAQLFLRRKGIIELREHKWVKIGSINQPPG